MLEEHPESCAQRVFPATVGCRLESVLRTLSVAERKILACQTLVRKGVSLGQTEADSPVGSIDFLQSHALNIA